MKYNTILCKLRLFKQSFGFSLIETLIAVGLLGLVAVGWLRMMKSSSDLSASAQSRQKVVAIEHYLLGFADCDKTKAQSNYTAGCNTGGSINLLDKFGNVIIPDTGRAFGNPQVTGGKIQVTNSCLNGATTFTATIPDSPPKTVTLFDGIPWYCPTKIEKFCKSAVDKLCPNQFAVLSIADGYGSGITYNHSMKCCPVPEDLLLQDHQYTASYCGADRVVTGVNGTGASKTLRCTKIDTTKYRLGPSAETVFFEILPYSSVAGFGGNKQKLELTTDISIPQKYFLMKTINTQTDPDFPGTMAENGDLASADHSQCISKNGNGIIVGRQNKNCKTHKTKEVQRLSDNTIVQLFPNGCTGSFTTNHNKIGNNDYFYVSMINTICSSFPTFWTESKNLKKAP